MNVHTNNSLRLHVRHNRTGCRAIGCIELRRKVHTIYYMFHVRNVYLFNLDMIGGIEGKGKKELIKRKIAGKWQ